MKKLFFAFVAFTVVVLSACDSKAPESTEAAPAEPAAVEAAAETTAPVDTTATEVVDTTAAPAN